MKAIPNAIVAGTAAVMFLVAGCAGKPPGPKTVRVSGTLYLDGKPLDGAEIRFISDEFVGFAQSGADGRYELVQGAVPGENVVTVRKIIGGFELDEEAGYDMGQLESALDAAGASPASQLKQIVPLHFSDPTKTKLRFTVPEGGTSSADLRLSSG